MKNNRLASLFRKYSSGSCTPEERAEFFLLVRNDENTAELQKLLDEEWQGSPQDPILDDLDSDRIFDAIVPPSVRNRRSSRLLGIAAGIAASVMILLFWGVFQKQDRTAISSNQTENELISSGDSLRLHFLPDGSKVTLNQQTTLTFGKDFGGNIREVTLEGEAYFDIAPDPSRPFIVRTGAIDVTVLGTAFNVKAYEKEEDITVTVNHGKVQVSRENNALSTLLPDQQITFRKIGNSIIEKQVKAETATEWQRKELSFDDVRMEEAAVVLEARFGRKIVFTDNRTADCLFSGTFLKDDSLEQILEALCTFNHASYRIENDRILIQGSGGCIQDN